MDEIEHHKNKSTEATLMNGKLAVFATPNSQTIAGKICGHLQRKLQEDVTLGNLVFEPFSDGEHFCCYTKSIRGKDVFIVGSTNPPADNMIQLLLAIDAAKRAHANRITVVTPYYGYARQERRKGKIAGEDRVSISAKLFGDCIVKAGADYIVVVDPHFKTMDGFFDIDFEHVWGTPTLVRKAKQRLSGKIVVVSPDAGGIDRARASGKEYGWPLAFLDKRREQANKSEVFHVVGDVSGANCLIVDDICDTAGTIVKGVDALFQAGAESVSVAITHPVLSGQAVERLAAARIKHIWFGDTIDLPPEKILPNMHIVTLAEVLGDSMLAIHQNTSVSEINR